MPGTEEPRTVLFHAACGKSWQPRVDKPVQCPHCHREINFDADIESGRIEIRAEDIASPSPPETA